MDPELVGYVAAVLTTAAYIPQAVKVVRSRHTSSISLGMYCLINVGIMLWFIYGVLIGSWPVILANGTTFIFAATILMMKLRHG
jgi:MtN3 and saliva related transmembrane protein